MSQPVKFGNYLLLKNIASGGMAELFLARQVGVMGFERIVAIKKILPHLTNDKEFVEMFINEAKLAAQITHPNVVQIYDFGVVSGTYFIAMEFLMGKSLSDILTKGNKVRNMVPAGLAVYIISKIAAGLNHAFQGTTFGGKPLGIVHRDISPQNILIGYNGDVKLVDFGIAKAASSNHHTQTGVLKGKLAYFSPEQAWGEPVDHRSDIFSLGIVLYEMLTERRLFKGENEMATIEKIRKGLIAPPSSIKSGLSKTIDDIVLTALSRNPDDRFQNAGELEEALTKYLRLSSAIPTAKELASYVAGLYPVEIKMSMDEFERIARVETKIVPEKPTATPMELHWSPGKGPALVKPIEAVRPVKEEKIDRTAKSESRVRAVKQKELSSEDKQTMVLIKFGLGFLGVVVALVMTGFIIMKVRTDASLSSQSTSPPVAEEKSAPDSPLPPIPVPGYNRPGGFK